MMPGRENAATRPNGVGMIVELAESPVGGNPTRTATTSGVAVAVLIMEVLISDFSETGDAERNRHMIRLDLDHALRWERADFFIGSWHTHDTEVGGAGPSRPDCESSLRASTKHPERIDVAIGTPPSSPLDWLP